MTNRSDCYSTNQVLSKTLMTRRSLNLRIEKNEFPAPRYKAKKQGRIDLYDKTEVDTWPKENCQWINARSRSPRKSVYIEVTSDELKDLRIAAKALGVDLEQHIREAAMFKSTQVLESLKLHPVFK